MTVERNGIVGLKRLFVPWFGRRAGMKSRLPDDTVEQLAPVLASVARLVADGRSISPKQLTILLQSVDLIYSDTLRVEIEKWAEFLLALKSATDEELEDVKATVRLALLQRGHLESRVDLAIASIVKSRNEESSISRDAIAISLGASEDQLDFGTVQPGETVTRRLRVWGGPGRIDVNSDQLAVSSQSFPEETTEIVVSLTPSRYSSVIFSSLELKTKYESLQIGVVAQIMDIPTSPAAAFVPASPEPEIIAPDVQQGLPIINPQQTASASAGPQKKKNSLPSWVYVLAGMALILLVGVPFVIRNGNNEEAGPVIVVVTATPTPRTQETPTPANTRTTATPRWTPTRPESTPTTRPRSTPTSRPRPTPTSRPRPTATPRPVANSENGIEEISIGRSARNNSIEAVRFGTGGDVVVFIGGMHAGFSPSTVAIAQRAVDYFSNNPDRIPSTATLYIVISASPDSPQAPGELSGRLNANGVDLNRNWDCRWAEDAKWRGVVYPGIGGPSPFSEPETRSLADFIQGVDAEAVVFWEARAVDGMVSPGNCGTRPRVSAALGDVYGRAAGYRVADFEDVTNQELNGDGTNWLDSISIPAIAVLLPSYTSTDWENNLKGMLAVLEKYGN